MDKIEKALKAGDDSKFSVCVNESYANMNHASKYSYLPKNKDKDSNLKRKTGKGRRSIILHAITTDGPLYEYEMETNRPVDNLKQSGNTCHPEPRKGRKLNYETLWIAQSHTGNYYDNMNSIMFMKWIEEKVGTVFSRSTLKRKWYWYVIMHHIIIHVRYDPLLA